MGFYRGPNIVTNGLVLALDAGNTKSYQSGSLTWTNLSNKTISSSINVGGGNVSVVQNPTALYISQSSGYPSSTLFTSPFTPSENFSIELWYKTDTTGSGIGIQAESPGIIQLGNYNNNASLTLWDWSVGTPGQHIIRTYVNNGATWSHVASSSLYSDNTWVGKYHQIVMNFSGSAGKSNSYSLYIDTAFIYTINFTIPFPSASIGGGNNITAPAANGGSAKNSYAVLRQYNKALSIEEITQNYNAMKGRFGL